MLVTLLNWVYIFFTSYIVGFFALPRIAKLIIKGCTPVFNWCDRVVAGLVIATVYAQIFSLFSGVGMAANAALVVFCIGALYVDRSKIKEEVFSRTRAGSAAVLQRTVRILLVILGLALFVLNLMHTAESSFHYDTGLYHAQSIHWLEDYGVIKGLGLLHVRFAYNSAYFPLCALYSMRDVMGGQSLHSMSGFISMILCMYSVYGWIKKCDICSGFIRIAPIFYFLICLLEITSPESDFVTIFLFIWLMIRLVEVNNCENEDNRLAGLCLLAISSFSLVGFKLSAAVFALVTVWPLVMLIRKKLWKSIILCGALAALMVLPYVVRNVIICGWPVYPVAHFDLFDVPWKFAKETLESDANEIGEWARLVHTGGSGDGSTIEWLKYWWDEQFLATRLFVSSFLLSLPVMIITLFTRSKWFVKYLMMVMLASVAFYMIKAPLIRYGYGPVLVFPLMVMGYVLESSVRSKKIVGIIISAAVSIVILLPSLYSTKELVKFDYEESCGRFSYTDHLVKQVDYPIADVREVDWYGQRVYLPNEGDQCWYYAFPSSPYHECFDYNMPVSDDLADGVKRIDQ
ncbi:MAG: hypothetical protein J5910_03985 [Lachnospiraceae bacterium]|nr:hypothetical protein [Lachnospiraceae bacterium]